MKDVRKTLGTLTTALATITTKVDNLTNSRTPEAATLPEHPGTSAMGNPTATFSAVPDPSMEDQVWIQVAQWMRSSHPSFLAITGDEMDGEEKEPLPTTRRSNITSGKLRSADTIAIKKSVMAS